MLRPSLLRAEQEESETEIFYGEKKQNGETAPLYILPTGFGFVFCLGLRKMFPSSL